MIYTGLILVFYTKIAMPSHYGTIFASVIASKCSLRIRQIPICNLIILLGLIFTLTLIKIVSKKR